MLARHHVLSFNAPLRVQGGSLRIQNSTFVRNRAVRAGAIILRNSKLDANLTSFSNNGNSTASPEVCPVGVHVTPYPCTLEVCIGTM